MGVQSSLLGVVSSATGLAKWKKEKQIQEERNENQKRYFELIGNEKLKKSKAERGKINAEARKTRAEAEAIKVQIAAQTAALANGRSMLAADNKKTQQKSIDEKIEMLKASIGVI